MQAGPTAAAWQGCAACAALRAHPALTAHPPPPPRYPCEGTLRPWECALDGTLQGLAQACSGDAECAAVAVKQRTGEGVAGRHGCGIARVLRPAGAPARCHTSSHCLSPPADLPLATTWNASTLWRGFLRNDTSVRLIMPTSSIYVKQGSSSGSSSGLSAGAIAGIAVGACAAAALAAGLAALLLVRRRRRRQQAQEPRGSGKQPPGSSKGSACLLTDPSPSGSCTALPELAQVRLPLAVVGPL